MHGVALGARQAADVVGRQRDGVALPLGGQRLAVGRELAANAVGVGNQEGRAQPVAQVAVGVVVHVEHLLGAGQVGRGQHVHVALAGEVGGDLQNLHAAAGSEGDAGELRLGGADGGAGESDDLLAADLGDVLGVAAGKEQARHQDRQDNGKSSKRTDHWLHLESIPESAVGIFGILSRAGLPGTRKRIPKAASFYPNWAGRAERIGS